jgi:alpha-tubulin suppressor-like RCC1 family protein
VDVSGLTSGVTSITAGLQHACALTSAAGVKCWGDNGSGQLGNGSTADSSVPVDVSGLSSGIAAVAAGNSFTCALTTGGGVKCWGLGTSGQLGNGLTPNSPVPVDVLGLSSGVTAIATGTGHACARLATGGVKCWGANGYGQFGIGNSYTTLAVVDAAGLVRGVTAIATGFGHNCVLMDSTGVKCWGRNVKGELGDGATAVTSGLVSVSGLASDVTSIAAGYSNSCAITGVGTARCWGANELGQLGNGSRIGSSVPVNVSGLSSGVRQIAVGASHICALMTTGGVKCWGGNVSGSLGNGSNLLSTNPVDVLLSGSTAPGTTSAWQAQVGPSGVNGTANVSAIAGGVGTIGLALAKLGRTSTLPVAVYKGSCASVGAVLFRLALIRTTSIGTASRTSALTAAQVRLVLAATAGSGKIAIRVGTGASGKCGAFAKRSVLGPQAVVQKFYDWYLTDQNYNHLLTRPELTPAFVRWLKAFSWGYNPIVCAQDVPDWAKAGAAAISGSSGVVRVIESFTPSAAGIPVKLALGPKGWQISGVQCMP